MTGYDTITRPWHYNWHSSGVECKEVCDDLPRWIGDAISYIWRRNHKGQPIDDRRKAIERLGEATPDRWEWLATKGVPVATSNAIERFQDRDEYAVSPDETLDLAVTLLTIAMYAPERDVNGIKNLVIERLTKELNKLEENNG